MEREIRELIKKKFRELNIPEDHVEHVLQCESCYNFLVKRVKKQTT